MVAKNTDNIENEIDNMPIRATLEALEIGDTAEFPAHRFSSVSVSCTNYGFETGRKYSVSKDRVNNKTSVKRIK